MKKTANIQLLILHLTIWCTLWSEKYSNCQLSSINLTKHECKHNQLHYQFSHNQQLLLQLYLEFFTPLHWVMNCSFGGCVLSSIIRYYSYVSGDAICSSVRVKSR